MEGMAEELAQFGVGINLGEGAGEKAFGDEKEFDVLPVPTSPQMSALGAFIRKVFRENADHRQMSGVDQMLLDAMRASKGEYSPEQLAKFRMAGLPENIFTPLTITKQRAALSQLSEMFTSPGDKTWTLSASPMPQVPESVAKEAFARIVGEFMEVVQAQVQAAAAAGREPDETMVPSPEQVFRYAESRMDEVHRQQIEWAKVRAERMERLVHDQMIEGGWLDAFNEFAKYLVDYGTAAILGPVPRVEMRKKVRETSLGTYRYELVPTEVLTYEAVDPWDLYPSKGAKSVKDGHLCIRRRFTASSLWRYASKRAKGAADGGDWFVGTIEALLSRHPEGGLRIDGQPYDLARAVLEKDGPSDTNRCVMEGVEFFGEVRGSMLWQLGILKTQDGKAIDMAEYYDVDAIEIGGFVVYCKILDPLVGRPISKGVFYQDAGSWWGGNIAQRLDATQRVVNAALRNLVNNMAMASGPMLFVKDVSRLVDKTDDALKVRPWKVLKFNMGGYGQTDVPVGSLNFESHILELLKVFDWAKQQADDDSGIPAYTYGMNVSGGALRTSSGLTMMLSEANRVMKMVEVGIDQDVVRDVVRRTVDWNMVYGSDLSVKGDCEVNPAGVVGLVLREAESTRRKQMMQLALNPAAMQVLGPKPFAELFRAELYGGEYGLRNVEDAMPTKERMEEQEMLQQLRQFNEAMSASAQARQTAAGAPATEGEGAPQGQMDAQAAMAGGAAPREEVASPMYAPVSANRMIEGGGQVAERRAAA